MILRIVRMTFQQEKADDFTELFSSVSKDIRSFPGCTYLKLMRDHNNPQVFVTYSKWQSEKDLNAYRNSDLFIDTWAKTKILFADKPVAFSLDDFSGEIEI